LHTYENPNNYKEAKETLLETNLYCNMKIYIDIHNQRLIFALKILKRAMKKWNKRINQETKIESKENYLMVQTEPYNDKMANKFERSLKTTKVIEKLNSMKIKYSL
jgi:hypothetical protein